MADKVIIQYDAEIRGLNQKLDQVIAKQDELAGKVEGGNKKQQRAIKDTERQTDLLGSSMDRLAGFVATAFAVGSVTQFGREIIDVTRKTELLQNQLNFVAGSTEGGQRLFRQLQAEAKRLGLEFDSLAKGFTGFAVASKQAGFTSQQSLAIYKQLAAGIRGAGASSQAAERAFYALEQMMSKGKVSSEELRQQLGEALPGSTAIAAKALGVTTAEFNKMLETGQIISADFIPKFAAAVENEFAGALSGKSNSADAAISRMNNALQDLKRNLGDAEVLNTFATKTAQLVDRYNLILQSNESGWQKAGRALAEFLTFGQANVEFINEEAAAREKQAKQDEQRTASIAKQVEGLKDLNSAQLAAKKSELETAIASLEAKKGTAKFGRLESDVLEQNKALLSGILDIETKAEQQRSAAAEKRKADEAIFLKNAVTLAQIRLAESRNPFERIAAERELLIATSKLQLSNEKLTANEKRLINVNLNNELKKNDQAAAQNRFNVFSETLEEEGIEVDESIMKRLQKDIEYNWEKRGLDEATYKKQLKQIEDVNAAQEEQQRRAKQNAIAIFGTFTSLISEFAQTNNQIEQQEADRAISNQEALLQKGLISQNQYERNIAEIKRRAFESQKEAAIIDARIKTAQAILQLYASLPFPAALIATPFAIALGQRQIDAIQSQPVPTFHEGGVDIGPGHKRTSGRLKSDEFMAKLQTGESVIHRDGTSAYPKELQAIQNGKLEDYIARHYVAPALKRSADVAGAAISQTATSMEMAFQQAELVNAVRGNKVVKLHKDTVKELAGALSPGTAGKVLARRAWR